MAQISDVMHASAVFDAARQELAWAYSGEFTDMPTKPMKEAVDTISEVLNEAQMRWVASTREEEPMAAVVDREKGMAVVVTGAGEDVGVVKEVDTRSVGEAEMKIKDWLLRLQEVACDMGAVARKELLGDYSRIDDDKPSARWFSCFPRTSRAARAARIAPTIDTFALELEKLKEQYHKEFGHSTGLPLAATCTGQPACSSAAAGKKERETRVTGDVLVEKDDYVKQRIIGIINGVTSRPNPSNATIVSIVGPSLVGKTTLVKSVFHECRADYKVWLDLRKGCDIKEIHLSILQLLADFVDSAEMHNVDYSGCPSFSEAEFGYFINKVLEDDKKWVLLVLDNLVEERDCSMLDELLQYLGKDTMRVITIAITRSEDLARYIASYDDGETKLVNVFKYRLSDDMCWEIIKRTSGLDLEATAAGTAVAVSEMVGREIASKCSGIPLAAKVLGRYLQSVDPRDVWNIGGGFSRDSQQLRRLPIHSATVFTHLKRSRVDLGVGAESWLSLAYCAFVFRKGKGGHGVFMHDLLNQWCSLGITTRERGAKCISELLDRSLISYASEDETDAASELRMEDLMHDFARYLLGDRLIIVDGKNGGSSSTSSPVNNEGSSAYLAVVSNSDAEQLDISSILPAGILALRFEGCGQMQLSDGAFGKYLRLLDLSGFSEKKMLPDSIGHLKQLRYLKAPGIQDQKFPRSIIRLQELRYLILRGSCQLEDLTKQFLFLTHLLHLDLSECTKLKALPVLIGSLWRLERLDLSACPGIETLPESFGWLRNLSHLDLSRCSGLKALPDSFGRLLRLEHLDLSACSKIESLPNSFHQLGNLSHLYMSRCSGLKALPESFRMLTSLWHLDLSRCSGLKALPESFGMLTRLWHLDLSRCSGLPDLPTSFKHLTELRHLDLSGLSSLQRLPMASIPRELRYLNLSGCSGLQLGYADFPDVPEANELRHLDLSGCALSLMPRSCHKFKWLVHLNLSGCTHLLGSLFHTKKWPRQLEHLDLSYSPYITFRIPHYSLQRLQYLDLSGTDGCSQNEISDLLQTIRSRGGRASGPADPSLREGTSDTTDLNTVPEGGEELPDLNKKPDEHEEEDNPLEDGVDAIEVEGSVRFGHHPDHIEQEEIHQGDNVVHPFDLNYPPAEQGNLHAGNDSTALQEELDTLDDLIQEFGVYSDDVDIISDEEELPDSDDDEDQQTQQEEATNRISGHNFFFSRHTTFQQL